MPSGWDSDQKLDIIMETLTDLELPIPQQNDTSLLMSHRDDNCIEIEDEQVFLQRLAVLCASDSGASGPGTSSSPKRDHSIGGKTDRNSLGASNAAPGTNLTGDNTALMSFFNNLLKKDTGKIFNIFNFNL